MRSEASYRESRDFRAGMRALAAHRPDQAIRSLRAAAESCPATRPAELERYLYWLAISLLRLDRPELALKSLASAQKLRPRGFARAVYARRANDYGMPRRSSSELDDFYAFYSMQIGAYFTRKGEACFEDCAEKDAVVRLVGEAWRFLSHSGALSGLDASGKLACFRAARLSFPAFRLSRSQISTTIPVDFRRKALLRGEERCPCGSGLPYRRCCGRTASPGELYCE